MNTIHQMGGRWPSVLAKSLLIGVCACPLALFAQPSDTNHGSPTGIGSATERGLNNSNQNGIGQAAVPEASTWAAMGAAILVAGILIRRRRRLIVLG
jgi:hypothetical protein